MGVYRFVGWFLFQYCLHVTIVPHVVPLLATKFGMLSINSEKDTLLFLIDTGDVVFNCNRKLKKGVAIHLQQRGLKQIRRKLHDFVNSLMMVSFVLQKKLPLFKVGVASSEITTNCSQFYGK